MPSFNLVDQPWIPLLKSDGTPTMLGLQDMFDTSEDLSEINDQSPLSVVAIHRLVLAIIHRVYGPHGVPEWKRLWDLGTLGTPEIRRYLAGTRDQFDLFDERRPFYQDASIDRTYAHPVVGLAHELAGKAGSDLFNHGLAEETSVSPAQAARLLLAHQCFAVGGLVSLEKGQDPKVYKSATAAPLTKGAVVMVRGSTLFHTLLLNLNWYEPSQERPFAVAAGAIDLPRWERNEPTVGAERWPNGYLDLLTWQSRRIRLFPEVGTDGQIVVANVAIMKGQQFPPTFERQGHETMLAFTAAKDPKAPDPWPAVTFREERALWRDSVALFESISGKQKRPLVLDWLAELTAEGVIERMKAIPLEVAGLGVDRAKVFFWRQERFPVPPIYLGDKQLLSSLRLALTMAEEAASAVRFSGRVLATLLLAPTSDAKEKRQPLSADVDKLTAALALERAHWGSLQTLFYRLLEALPGDVIDDDQGKTYGSRLLVEWADDLRRTARRTLSDAANTLDTSARALKAVAVAERALGRSMNRAETLKGYRNQDAAKEAML